MPDYIEKKEILILVISRMEPLQQRDGIELENNSNYVDDSINSSVLSRGWEGGRGGGRGDTKHHPPRPTPKHLFTRIPPHHPQPWLRRYTSEMLWMAQRTTHNLPNWHFITFLYLDLILISSTWSFYSSCTRLFSSIRPAPSYLAW